MFLFLSLKGVTDSLTLIRNQAVEKGVLALPGVARLPLTWSGQSISSHSAQVFMPSGTATSSVRVSFSLASEVDAELAFSRLREVLLEAREARRTL